MSTHFQFSVIPGFSHSLGFLHYFVLAKVADSSIRVNIGGIITMPLLA